jgi:hypothetical protein
MMKVKMEFKEVPIEELAVGNVVYSFDEDEFGFIVEIGHTLLHKHKFIVVRWVCVEQEYSFDNSAKFDVTTETYYYGRGLMLMKMKLSR